MEIKHILAFICISIFLGYFFLNKFPRRSYLLFLLIFIPFIDLNVTPEKFGSISVFDFITFFVFFFAFEDIFYFSRNKNVYYFLFIVLSGLLFIGSIRSEFIVNSLFNFLKYFSIFIYSKMLIDECIKDSNFIKLVIRSLKVGCILSLVFLIIQLVIGTKFTFYTDLNPNTYLELGRDTLRYPSYFQDPQKYAQYLSMLSFLFLMNRESKSARDILNVFGFILVVLAILLTGGRAAFIGLCIGLLIILFSKRGKIWMVAVIIGLVGFFISVKFPGYFSLFNRTDDLQTSFETRNEIWKEDIQLIFEKPVFGIGIGNHHEYIVKHSSGGYYLIDNEIVYYGTESGYLQIIAEFGILGFILVFLLILIPVFNSIRSYLQSHNSNIILIIASVISWMTAFTTINSLSDKRILVVLITLLCLLIVSKNSSEEIHV